MPSLRLITFSTILALIFAIIYFLINKNQNIDNNLEHKQRLLRFNYELTNTTSNAITNFEFKTYLPVIELDHQALQSIKTSHPYTITKDVLGNQVASFNLALIPPFGKKAISITTIVDMTRQSLKSGSHDDSLYLTESKYIESHHDQIISLAKSLEKNSKLESLRNIYDWVSSNIQYSGYTPEDKGALNALTLKKGDCTEYMYLVIALARAIKIPARAVGGYVYSKNTIVSAADYHNWAEVKIDGKWHIVDAQKKSFMQNMENYIAMRLIESQGVNLLGNSHRFASTDNRIKISI